MARKRMTLPKKKEDLDKIIEEVESTHHHDHGHEHEHHHHHHGIEETVEVLNLIVDSLNANVRNLENRVTNLTLEVARLYKILALITQALAADSDDEKRRLLEEALKAAREH